MSRRSQAQRPASHLTLRAVQDFPTAWAAFARGRAGLSPESATHWPVLAGLDVDRGTTGGTKHTQPFRRRYDQSRGGYPGHRRLRGRVR